MIHKNSELKIIERSFSGGVATIELNGERKEVTRAREITANPFYEPFFGWFVAEGWNTKNCYDRCEGLIIIYHKVGNVGENTPAHPPKWDKIDGFDYLKYV